MASQTTYYNLIKPATSDPADIADINSNSDIIDSALNSLNSQKAPILKVATFNSGNAITAAGTYTVTVSGITDYWRPTEIILSDETAVLVQWTWSIGSDGVCSLTIPTKGIRSSGTTVTFILAQSDSNS